MPVQRPGANENGTSRSRKKARNQSREGTPDDQADEARAAVAVRQPFGESRSSLDRQCSDDDAHDPQAEKHPSGNTEGRDLP